MKSTLEVISKKGLNLGHVVTSLSPFAIQYIFFSESKIVLKNNETHLGVIIVRCR